MKREYDFSKARQNPYSKHLKRQVTIRLEQATLGYFKQLALDSGVPYQTPIDLHLRDCATSGRRLHLRWVAGAWSRGSNNALQVTGTPGASAGCTLACARS
jgi:hypothetical protein